MLPGPRYTEDQEGSHRNDRSRVQAGESDVARQSTDIAQPRDWPHHTVSGAIQDEWALDPIAYDQLFGSVDFNNAFGWEGFVPVTTGLPNTSSAPVFPYQPPITAPHLHWPSPVSASSSELEFSYETPYTNPIAVTHAPTIQNVSAPPFEQVLLTPQIYDPNPVANISPPSPLHVEAYQPIHSHSPIIPVYRDRAVPQREVPSKTSKQAVRKAALQGQHAERRAKAKRPKREGPLSLESRRKAEDMRDVGACWRCRKYKKSCNGDSICDSCLIPNFKVWPTELGCRRERLGTLVLFLLPSSFEIEIQKYSSPIKKGRSWRKLNLPACSETTLIKANVPRNWALSIDAVQSTGLFRDDYAKLVSIITEYQRTLAKPVPCLETGCSLLIAISVFYHSFVETDRGQFTKAEAIKAISEVRKLLARSFIQLEKLCLSSKRSDWFPAFLGCCLLVCGSIMYIDAMIAVQEPLASKIWGNSHERRASMRQRGYHMMIDYLRASTNGINPLKLRALAFSDPTVVSTNDRAAVLEYDSAAISGIQMLQTWHVDHKRLLAEGKEMFQKQAYNLSNIWPVAGLFLLFDWS